MQLNIEGFPDYKYDDVTLRVVSYKGAYARPLTWVGPHKSVALYKNGFRHVKTALEIMTLIKAKASIKQEGVVMANKFIIGSKSSNGFSFAAKPVEHDTEIQARTEAERLARGNPGKTFVVVKIVGSVVSNAVSWK